ncbi:UDP-N-acetylmuramoyl-L-alanine--D-glutamate ligase [Burkholderiaceae bacterium]|nr:UDP-N-acetylmuramoyl-L-alanine--D-glutamate ligase [Burkholderiaceae bacterium]
MHLADQHQVLVLGMGISGLAMARWCARRGDKVTLVDSRSDGALLDRVRSEMPGVDVQQRPLDTELMTVAPWAMIYVSPGLSPSDLSAVSNWADAHTVRVCGELDLFIEGLRVHEPAAEPTSEALDAEFEVEIETEADVGTEADVDVDVDADVDEDPETPASGPIDPITPAVTVKSRAPKVLAVTGTNGKTTVTALTHHLLRWAGVQAVAAGNIGPSMLDALMACLDNNEWPAVWVLELSSFQLARANDFNPSAATILNISQDHMDWHGDMAAYGAAKQRIFGNTSLRVLNRDDGESMRSQPPPPPALKRKERPVPGPTWESFGADAPTRPGDWGLEETNGLTWLVRAQAVDEVVRAGKKDAAPVEVFLQRLMPADALRIRGRHNACNALAALALATAGGGALGPMLHALREYVGEPHRVQPVGVIGDVEYIDDSKGTNVGATLAALHSLGAERRLVVILGGDGKGQDFSVLRDAVRRYARAVVLMGRDAGLIGDTLRDTGVPLLPATDMVDAVQQAAAAAKVGDVVLLSPACASFDMYRNYLARATAFTDAVTTLAENNGEVRA